MFWQQSREKSGYSSGYSLAASPLALRGSSAGKKVPWAKEFCQLCRLTRYHGFEVLHFPVMQSLFSFVCVVEILAVPTTSLINNPRHLTFFVKYQFGEAKFSVARGGLKMTVPFMYKFQSLPNKFPMIF